MKLTCDLCGGELEMKAEGAVCGHCGLEYGEDRLREKRNEQKTQPAPKTKKKPSAAKKKEAEKKKNTFWKTLMWIGIFAFFGAIFLDPATTFVICVFALLITLLYYRPWKG